MGARGRGVKKFLNRQANVGLAKLGHSPPLRQEATGPCFSLEAVNLYPGVHVRGLRLVGVTPPLRRAGAALASGDVDDPLVEPCREELVGATDGTRLPRDTGWYRVSS